MGVSCCSFLEVWRKWHFPLIRGFPPSRSSPCRGDGAYAILWPCHETATKTNICFLPFLFKGIIAASRNNNKLPVLTMISSKNRICKCSHFRSVLFQSNRLNKQTVGSCGFIPSSPPRLNTQKWRQTWSFIINHHQIVSLIIGIRTSHISNVQRFSFSWYDIWKSLSIDI